MAIGNVKNVTILTSPTVRNAIAVSCQRIKPGIRKRYFSFGYEKYVICRKVVEIRTEKKVNQSMFQIQMIGNAIYVVILILLEGKGVIGVMKISPNVSLKKVSLMIKKMINDY